MTPRQPKRKTTLENRARRAAVAGASRNGHDEVDPLITLSNGIVLRVKPVPSLALREAAMQIEEPAVPVVHMEDKGRDEENPNDPRYIDAMNEAMTARALAANDVILLLGTEIESIPEGLQRVEDEGWLDDLEFLNIAVDKENPRARRLAYLKFYAVATDEDTIRALAGPMRSVGVSEEDVARSVASFRRPATRPADRTS